MTPLKFIPVLPAMTYIGKHRVACAISVIKNLSKTAVLFFSNHVTVLTWSIFSDHVIYCSIKISEE